MHKTIHKYKEFKIHTYAQKFINTKYTILQEIHNKYNITKYKIPRIPKYTKMNIKTQQNNNTTCTTENTKMHKTIHKI